MPHRLWLLFFFLPLLTACNVYHPLKGGIGYTELPVGSDGFQVTYSAPSDMSVAEARRFALIRCAELAALQDKPYFQIVNERVTIFNGLQYYPGMETAVAPEVVDRHGYVHTAYINRFYEPGYYEPYTVPEVWMQIKLDAQPGEKTIPAAYLLRQALADKVKLSRGVAEKVPELPEVTGPVTIPPPPASAHAH